MRNINDLRRLVTKHFPEGSVEDDNGEVVIRTGLSLVDKELVSMGQDESGLDDVEPERPEFGRYKGA